MTRKESIPYGYCQCGCGQKTNVARQTQSTRGQVRGEPMRYVHGHGKRKQTTEERFWQRVDRSDNDSCWLWLGATNDFGHGTISVTSSGRSKSILAHRLSYELNVQPIPAGMVVRHKCDVPGCVNPAHLELGSQIENIGDMIQRRRQSQPPHPKGKAHHNLKLSDDDVRAIRKSASEGQRQAEMVRHYKVSRSVISQIVSGKTRTDVM